MRICKTRSASDSTAKPTKPNRMVSLLSSALLGTVLTTFSVTFSMQAHTEGLPELGDSSDAVVSAPQERAIGRRIMIEIRGDSAFIDDEELVDYINSIGNKLVAASPGATNDNRREFEFFMLNDDSINAFALLGGFVGVHTGLILTTTNESELASVIGHEIAHVLQRHQSRGADEQRKNAPMSLLGLAAAILAARSGSQSRTSLAWTRSNVLEGRGSVVMSCFRISILSGRPTTF